MVPSLSGERGPRVGAPLRALCGVCSPPPPHSPPHLSSLILPLLPLLSLRLLLPLFLTSAGRWWLTQGRQTDLGWPPLGVIAGGVPAGPGPKPCGWALTPSPESRPRSWQLGQLPRRPPCPQVPLPRRSLMSGDQEGTQPFPAWPPEGAPSQRSGSSQGRCLQAGTGLSSSLTPSSLCMWTPSWARPGTPTLLPCSADPP